MADEVDIFATGMQIQLTNQFTYLVLPPSGGHWLTDRDHLSNVSQVVYQMQWQFQGEVYIESNVRMVVAHMAIQFYHLVDLSLTTDETAAFGAFGAAIGRLHILQEAVLDAEWWELNTAVQHVEEIPTLAQEPIRDGSILWWGMSTTLLISGL